jgi:hypothetical protein
VARTGLAFEPRPKSAGVESDLPSG